MTRKIRSVSVPFPASHTPGLSCLNCLPGLPAGCLPRRSANGLPRLPVDCLPRQPVSTVGRLPACCLSTACRLPANCLPTSCLDSLLTACQLPADCLSNAGFNCLPELPAGYRRRLPADCLPRRPADCLSRLLTSTAGLDSQPSACRLPDETACQLPAICLLAGSLPRQAADCLAIAC